MMTVQVDQLLNAEVQEALDAIKNRTIDHVFFVACGGSQALMYPSKYLLDREVETIDSDVYNADEFIHRNPVNLGDHSLVILVSHSGTTPEVVKATKFAREKGALTVALSAKKDSPLLQEAEFSILYHDASYADKKSVAKGNDFYIVYQLVTGLVATKKGDKLFHSMLTSLENLDAVFEKVKEQVAGSAKQFGEKYKDADIIYTIGSGADYSAAYMFAVCILMEMQWIHSHPIHAGEFFHGPFEVLDKDVPFIILLGLDETRPLEERALDFARKYGDNVIVIDAKELDTTGIEEDVKGYLSPFVLNKALDVYATELAEARNHSLETRRYMGKVDY